MQQIIHEANLPGDIVSWLAVWQGKATGKGAAVDLASLALPCLFKLIHGPCTTPPHPISPDRTTPLPWLCRCRSWTRT